MSSPRKKPRAKIVRELVLAWRDHDKASEDFIARVAESAARDDSADVFFQACEASGEFMQ